MTSVKCAIRVRPFSPKETMDKTKNIIEMSGPTTTITDPSWFERKENLDAITAEDTEYLYKKSFTFDHSFWSFNGNDNHFSSQENIFEHLGTFVLDNALNAFNCSIFAYGQTSSGKTFTMQGCEASPGVVALAAECIFDSIKRQADRDFVVRVSYIEVYNEKINDLLNPSEDGDTNGKDMVIEKNDVNADVDALRTLVYALIARFVIAMLASLVVNSGSIWGQPALIC